MALRKDLNIKLVIQLKLENRIIVKRKISKLKLLIVKTTIFKYSQKELL